MSGALNALQRVIRAIRAELIIWKRIMDFLIVKYIDSIEDALKLISRLLQKLGIKSFRFGPLEFKLHPSGQDSYEQTFNKIEKAQEHLTDAVDSIEKLKTQFSDEKDHLEK